MKKILISLVWLLAMLMACTTPNIESPTNIAETVTQNPTPTHPVVEISPIGDGGLISDQPCASPCFFGINIGQTQLNQVISILETNKISPCYYDGETRIECGKDVFYIIVGADPSTFIVDGIVYYPNVSISVTDIIDKYGNPNFVYVEPEGIPEATYVTMFLLWNSIKMRVDLPEVSDIGEQSYVVDNTTEAQKITFLNETSYSSPATGGFSQTWKGYGIYKP